MVELEMTHILMVLIAGFLLYHLMGRCGCSRGGNGFRVGEFKKECNNNGLLKENGICECYDDYYGKSCEINGVKCRDTDGGLESLCGGEKKKSQIKCGECINENKQKLQDKGCSGNDAEQWCNNDYLDNHRCELDQNYSKDGDGVEPCLQCEQCDVGTKTNSSCTIYNNTDCSLNKNANINATCTQSDGNILDRFNHCINQTDCVYSQDMPLNNCVNIKTYNAFDGHSPLGGQNLYNISQTRNDICNNAERNYGAGMLWYDNDQKKACANIGSKYNQIRKGICKYEINIGGNTCTFLPNPS
jgi:hypothetical protein